ncbi:MAG: 3-phosphoshikimate 1-carboxyvinyltransferase [Nitrosopumilus sp.]|nr:3-phosphoshikimate 1-carboxyvinyltransferase [Nitrosopumilus sp.]MDA7942898.1 3-phosphoshikimate 1-carboxyvinyltransferase [Nitrosopumilus sp.]MDA7998748.1 3-phosphoshikimate 1-carboxyvinyltransferase [Nitrosopumilus sp.]
MDCTVERSRVSGRAACPPSKSYTHRAVFLGSLAGGTVVEGALDSGDALSTVSACRAMGASIDEGGDIVIRDPIGGGDAEIDAGNSGTTMRMAAGIAALRPARTTIRGDDSLQRRPMGALLSALEQAGASCTSEGGLPPVSVTGPMRGGAVSIGGGTSSQFISALLAAAPATEEGISIRVEGAQVSRPYVGATIAAMARFGASAGATDEGYSAAPARYRGCRFRVPSDYSSMALLASAAVLAGELEISHDDGGLPQGDKKYLAMISGMGAEVRDSGGLARISAPDGVSGGEFDLGDTPDLLPPLAILALAASGPIRITNVGHARAKETDRISVVAAELGKLGVGAREGPDWLELGPPAEPRGAVLDPRGDHRLFMAFFIAGMRVGRCRVLGAESASISYPGFVGQMRRLGAITS